MSKLAYRVCYASGEEHDYPATELNLHSPHTRGWQSPQFCDYPQELGLEMPVPCRVTQVQVLSHENKIATQIELYIGTGASYETAQFERLGYMSLNDNQVSDYQARELKSVYIQAEGQFLKLKIHKCYSNNRDLNLFSQVGIIAINLGGEPLDSVEARSLHLKSRTRPERGMYPVLYLYLVSAFQTRLPVQPKSIQLDDLSFDMNFDPATAQRIRGIIRAKEVAVKMEEYDSAKALKQIEVELKSLGGRLAQLDLAKREAVEDEDYDRAKKMKLEAESLREEIDAKLNDDDLKEVMSQLPVPGAQGSGMHGFVSNGVVVGAAIPNIDNQVVGSRSGSGQYPPISMDDQPVGPIGGSSPSPSLPAPQGARGAGGAPSATPSSLSPPFPQSHEHSGRRGLPAGFGPGSDLPSVSPDGGERPIHGSEGHQYQQLHDTGAGNSASSFAPSFPPGQHPLEGVPNAEDLPAPEPLSTKVDLSEVQGLNAVFGEYRVRCLYSKTWTLREAAINKTRMMLEELEGEIGLEALLPHVLQITRVGCEDKISQVFLTCVELLETFLDTLRGRRDVKHGNLVSLLEPVVNTLLLKLGDGQARVRDGAMIGVMSIAHCKAVGAGFVGHLALPKKPLTSWRPITARIQLVKSLVEDFGLGGHGGGLTTENVMGFIHSCNGFAHSNSQVRDASRELTVAVYSVVGHEVERYLGSLRPKQLDEYHEAFARVKGGGQ
ncbi:unnamed protein product [Chrysoparadoxa australica]